MPVRDGLPLYVQRWCLQCKQCDEAIRNNRVATNADGLCVLQLTMNHLHVPSLTLMFIFLYPAQRACDREF